MKLLKLSLLSVLVFALSFLSCSKKDNTGPSSQNNTSKDLNNLNVGESANDLLSASNYDKLVVEIVSVQGYELDNSVINTFQSFLETRLNKPNGVSIVTTTIKNPELAPYTTQKVVDIENKNRAKFNTENEIAVYIFISEDAFEDNNILGQAYRNTSVCLMGGRIRELSGGLGQPSENLVLQTVLRHELGHILGLVNVGTPMVNDHQDKEHGHHCNIESCLMYYAVENSASLSNLLGTSSPPALDSQCLADLKANGGK